MFNSFTIKQNKEKIKLKMVRRLPKYLNIQKKWIEKRIGIEKVSDFAIERARAVMSDKRNHTLAQIEEAEEILARVEVIDDDLPF